MQYISTRGKSAPIAFQEAAIIGQAPDGGLFVPKEIPQVTTQLLEQWKALSFSELAFEIMQLYISDIPTSDLKAIIHQSYATFDCFEVTPVQRLKEVHIVELWHGPTLAFKDVALQFLSNVFEYILKRRKTTLNILGATSGDTGSAAIHGVKGKENINIFIMHPHGRTSQLQALQMTTVLDANVFNIAIEGTFDDCQNIMKCNCDGAKVAQLMTEFGNNGSITLPISGEVDPDFVAGAGNTQETMATIRKYYEQENYVLDPHTAVGVTVAERLHLPGRSICLATAHPAKFPDAICDATGKKDIAVHPVLQEILHRPSRFEILPNSIEKVKAFVMSKVKL